MGERFLRKAGPPLPEGSVGLGAASRAAALPKPQEIQKLEGQLLCSIRILCETLLFPGSTSSPALLNVKCLAGDPKHKR